MVTLVSRDPCGVCGYLRAGVGIYSMRINKRSMRSYGTNLVFFPGLCMECRVDTGNSPRLRWVLDPESAAEVQAYRLRRWPELASEPVGPSTPGGGPHG